LTVAVRAISRTGKAPGICYFLDRRAGPCKESHKIQLLILNNCFNLTAVFGVDMENRHKETDTSIKNKIIMAAIECIEKYGFHALTIRRIAKEAGVNVAAINYYFGSKKKLIDEVFRQTLHTGLEGNIDDFLIKYKDTPGKALEMFFLEMIGGGLNYPNLVKIHFYEAFLNNNYKTNSVKRVNTFLKSFEKYICSIKPGWNKKDCTMDMIQLWSAVFFPILFPDIFREYAVFDIRNPERQKEYISRLLKLYLGIQ
jgi:AcrR family transcriptional regulator